MGVRITCRTPSTGKATKATLKDVTTDYTTIAEAPDFSVPDTSNKYTERDPLDISRAIRPGEIFFLTPLAAKNKSATTQWIDVKFVAEDGIEIELGRVEVPAGDTAFIPLQGRSLLKRLPNAVNGDRIQVRAQSAGVFDVWSAAEEKLSSEHIGVE